MSDEIRSNAHASDMEVWKVLGPILLSITLLGGGGWLTYAQSQISDIRISLEERGSEISDLKERLRGVEVTTDQIKSSVDRIQSNSQDAAETLKRIREMLEEDRDSRRSPRRPPG